MYKDRKSKCTILFINAYITSLNHDNHANFTLLRYQYISNYIECNRSSTCLLAYMHINIKDERLYWRKYIWNVSTYSKHIRKTWCNTHWVNNIKTKSNTIANTKSKKLWRRSNQLSRFLVWFIDWMRRIEKSSRLKNILWASSSRHISTTLDPFYCSLELLNFQPKQNAFGLHTACSNLYSSTKKDRKSTSYQNL